MNRPASREGALLRVRVQPRGGRDAIAGWRDGVLRVRVSAPPTEGRANQAVIELLANSLGVPRSSIRLERGAGSRDKLFRLADCSLEELRARLPGAAR
ncbi:MAG TPA: DUF167 domain-containing protein [Candidatus Methylomirabilis sp.]|nr:DUF167 domain-containing protein [Candidatus Methylomirabilis sp.]